MDEVYNEKIGGMIRIERKLRKISLRSAARTCEISPTYLARIEAGTVGTPSRKVVCAIAECVGVNELFLLDLYGR